MVRNVPAAADGTAAPGLFGGRIVVTDDGAGVAEALVGLLGERGVDAVVATAVNSRDHVGLIYLGNLRAASGIDAAIALNRDAFDAAQDFANAGIGGGLFVVVDDQRDEVGSTVNGIDAGIDTTSAWASGLTALARTAALEWPTTTVKSIEIERG